MKNTIIKGTGNSRTLHFSVTAVTEYQTIADFLAAGASEAGIPIDIGPLKPEGVVQAGNPLNKSTLLKDETAEAHGFSSDAVPDDMWVGLVPVGGILWLASQTLPDGFLLCDGSNIGRNDYAKLFEVIGTQFGTGDGSTTFTLPDLRAAFVRGAGSQSRYASVFGRKTDATYLETVTTDGPYVHSYLLTGWTNDEVAGRLNVPIGNQDASYALSTCRMVRYGADNYIQNIGRTAYAVRPYNIALTPIIKY